MAQYKYSELHERRAANQASDVISLGASLSICMRLSDVYNITTSANFQATNLSRRFACFGHRLCHVMSINGYAQTAEARLP
jgi:hypothetical protein